MRKIWKTLPAALLALGLAACSTEPEKEGTTGFVPALDASKEGKVVVMGGYANFESLEAVFDDFNVYYPNVVLSYVKPDDYNNTITTILNGNDAPDIYFTYSWMNGKDQYIDCLKHAEDLSMFDLDVIRPGLLNKTESGEVLMVPVFATTHGMLVNEDLFAKEGLRVPTTWDELVTVCDTLLERGYPSPLMGYIPDTPSSGMLFTLAYPHYCSTVASDPAAIASANRLEPEAGEYMRPALDMITDLIDRGYVNQAECAKIEDGYTGVILRFFEGDVPMMIATGDTVSGTKKRESQSEAFTAHPFSYSFTVVPTNQTGAVLLDTPSLQFSVNKDSEDLELTNEFMRFLLSTEELNRMAEIKRLVTPTADLSYDTIYAPLNSIPADRILSPEALGLGDDITIQLRIASYMVAKGKLSVDEAVSQYGTFEQ